MEKRLKLSAYGQHLWGKSKAREVRLSYETVLDGLEPGDILAIDTAGVEAFDLTFAMELFGRLIAGAGGEYAGRFLLVEHMNDCTKANLTFTLEKLGLAVITRQEEHLSLLGKVNSSDIETFSECLLMGRTVSAALLSSRLGVSLTAMNERLAKLTAMGVLRRERGSSASGRIQYEYRLLN